VGIRSEVDRCSCAQKGICSTNSQSTSTAAEAARMKEEMARMEIRMLQDWTLHYLNNPLVEEVKTKAQKQNEGGL
jgi:hypothetical protein